VVNRLHGNAMIDGSGMAYQPPTVEDARRIEAEHGARIASDTFAWPCVSVESWSSCPPPEAFHAGHPVARSWRPTMAHAQCTRVAGHDGEHRGEVAW
jgi:hypothetical protein